MTKYKMINHFPQMEDTGEPIRLEVIYDNYDGIVNVMISNLNSFAKGLIFPKLSTEIMKVDDDEKVGMALYINNVLVKRTDNHVQDINEIMGTETQKYMESKGLI